MKIDPSRAIGAYAAVATLAAAWFALGGVAPPQSAGKFTTIDVERINVREADGTLRLAIANSRRIPKVLIDGQEYPHPNRTEAGIIFFNDEGFENGGLVFAGKREGDRVTNGGSLTFDRWRQDQTVQMMSDEDGAARQAGVYVTDRPDGPMNLEVMKRFGSAPKSELPGLLARLNADGRRRAFLGRDRKGVSQLELGDAQGKARLRLRVDPAGAARIEFLDAAGKVVRSVGPDGK